jgi:hypothetical protein
MVHFLAVFGAFAALPKQAHGIGCMRDHIVAIIPAAGFLKQHMTRQEGERHP